MKPHKPALKWSLPMVEQECGMDHRTAGKRFKAQDLQPDDKGKWTTKQVLSMLFGDYESERLRLTREQADKLALENAEARRELVSVAEVSESLGKFFSAAKQRIYSNPKLEDEEKDRIARELQQAIDSLSGGSSAPAGDT